MEDNQKKKLIRLFIPVFIVLILLILWKVKNTHPVVAEEPSQIEVNEDFVLEANEINLEQLKKYNLPIIIDFGADSCIPCKEMAPVLKTLNEEMQNKAIIKFVDVWKNANGANGFPIQVIPTQVLINSDGSPYTPSEDIEINFIMYSSRETNEHVFTVHQGGLSEEDMRIILKDMGVN